MTPRQNQEIKIMAFVTYDVIATVETTNVHKAVATFHDFIKEGVFTADLAWFECEIDWDNATVEYLNNKYEITTKLVMAISWNTKTEEEMERILAELPYSIHFSGNGTPANAVQGVRIVNAAN